MVVQPQEKRTMQFQFLISSLNHKRFRLKFNKILEDQINVMLLCVAL